MRGKGERREGQRNSGGQWRGGWEKGLGGSWGTWRGGWEGSHSLGRGLWCPPDPVPHVPPALPCQLHPSPLKRSLALVPGSPQPGPGGDWAGSGGPEDPPAAPRGPPPAPFGDHAPLSPQSSVASSGSEHTEEPGGRNSFQEDGSGMKGGQGAPGGLLGVSTGHCHLTAPPCPPRCPLVAEEPAAAQVRGAVRADELRGDDDADRAPPGITGGH